MSARQCRFFCGKHGAAAWLGAAVWLGVAAWPSAATGLDLAEPDRPFRPALPRPSSAADVLRHVRAAVPGLFMQLPERLRAWGYPLETHTVRTEDGYLLTLHRVRHGRLGTVPTAPARPPALLLHGFLGCSEVWVLGGPGVAPGLMLADGGFDVWMMNVRGNHYSLHHDTLGHHDARFWAFSWHEVSLYDVPAAVDYVLNATRQQRLFAVSHSLGGLLFNVAASLRPELNAKVRLHVALAPAVFINDISGLLRAAVDSTDILKVAFDALSVNGLLLRSDALSALWYLLCRDAAYFGKICAVLYSMTMGAMDLNDTSDLYLKLARAFSSTSTQLAVHCAQLVRSGEVRQMDYGISNMLIYGSLKPSRYPLEKVTMPTAIFGASNDFMTSIKGLLKLSKKLPNVVSFRILNETLFNHMSFVFHSKSKYLFMNDVLEIMKPL